MIKEGFHQGKFFKSRKKSIDNFELLPTEYQKNLAKSTPKLVRAAEFEKHSSRNINNIDKIVPIIEEN